MSKVTGHCDEEEGDKASPFSVKQASKRADLYMPLSCGATTVNTAQKQNRFR